MKEKCRSYLELIQLMIDGEINSAEEENLTKHLAVCPTCRADYQAFQQLDQLFVETKFISPPEELKGCVMTEISKLEETKKASEQRRVFQLIPGLAIFVLLNAILFLSRIWSLENLWSSLIDSWLVYLRFMQDLSRYIQVGLQIHQGLQMFLDMVLKSIPSSWLISLVCLTVLLSLGIWRLIVYNHKVN